MKEITIKEFMKKSLKDINLGCGDEYEIEGSIDFELKLGVNKTNKSKIDLKVLDLGLINKKEIIVQKVNFSLRSKKDYEFQTNKLFFSKIYEWLKKPFPEMIKDINLLSQNPNEIKKRISNLKSSEKKIKTKTKKK